MTKPKTVAVLDYGMGNLRSVSQAVQHVAKASGFEVVVTAKAEDVMNAMRLGDLLECRDSRYYFRSCLRPC